MLSTQISIALLSIISLAIAAPTPASHRNSHAAVNGTENAMVRSSKHHTSLNVTKNAIAGSSQHRVMKSRNGTTSHNGNTLSNNSDMQHELAASTADANHAASIAKQIAALQAQDVKILAAPLTKKSSATLKKNLDKIASLQAQKKNYVTHGRTALHKLVSLGGSASSGTHHDEHVLASAVNTTTKARLAKTHSNITKPHSGKPHSTKPKRSEKVDLFVV